MASAQAKNCYLKGVKLSDMPVKPIQDYWRAAGEREPFPNKTTLVERTVARIVELCPTPNGAGEYHVDGLNQVGPNAAAASSAGGNEMGIIQAKIHAMEDLLERQNDVIERQNDALQTLRAQQTAQSIRSAPAEWPQQDYHRCHRFHRRIGPHHDNHRCLHFRRRQHRVLGRRRENQGFHRARFSTQVRRRGQ